MNNAASAVGSSHMTLLRAMAFPLHMSSLLFVAMSSVILALVLSVGSVAILMVIIPVYIMMVWLTQFAFTMIDDVANGRREAATATAEMLTPFGDPRCWVHPALAAAIALTLFFQPQLPRTPILIAVWLLFPASIGAIAVSSRVIDALNPVAIWLVVRGLGPYYLLLLGGTLLAAGLGMWILQSDLVKVLRIALLQLLLLECYALIGGTLHLRRLELGFDPVVAPERELEQAEIDRQLQRQRVLDDVYRKLRVRETPKAIAAACEWLDALPAIEAQRDVMALLEASRSWSEPRAFGNLAQGMIRPLLAMRQPGLALATAEEAIRQGSAFAPSTEGDVVELARYAQQTGRKRVARTLLQNFVARKPAPDTGIEFQSLLRQLVDAERHQRP